jgi:uncharacterized repeat protein (TIGR01451 family)
MKKNQFNRLLVLCICLLFIGWLKPDFGFAQAIMGTAGDGDLAIVFPTPNAGLPTPTQNNVTGMPAGAQPHGVSYFGSDSALVSNFGLSQVFVVRISTASVLSTINTPSYDGTGTIAVAPTLTHALAVGQTSTLNVIHAPFNSSSTITTVTLPGTIASYQTQAIVFNNAGRAFVYHTTGISVLDPPYSSIAFTIPLANGISGAIAISPTGNRLLVTTFSDTVQIFSSPYSSGSTPSTLTIDGANGLDGIMVAPNGANALVAASNSAQVFAISSPFSGSSTVQQIPLPESLTSGPGFEDVGISANSQLAIITGNSVGSQAPAAFIEAPFTTAGATVHVVTVNGPGRGAGAVRFLPPGLAAGLSISKTAPATVPSGSNLTYTINYSNTGGTDVNNVIIRDPVPAGTTFVSATGGGSLSGNEVVWNIGTVPAGTVNQTVTFTVNVTATGGTIQNVNYTIEGTGVPPIAGPPVFTTVTGGGGGMPSISINNASRREGDSGTSILQFLVTLSAPSGTNVTVDFQTANGTATAGQDYQANSGTLLFTPGDTSQTIQITIIGDTRTEPNETLFVNLSNASGATIADPQGRGTILDDDGVANIVITPQNVDFGQVDVGTIAQAVITISNTGNADGFVTIQNTASVKASPSGTIRIPAGGSVQVTLSFIVPKKGSVSLAFPVISGRSTIRLNLTANGVTGPLGFVDISQRSGIANQNIRTTGVQWIDYNGDGDLDLLLVGSNGNALFRNEGNKKFTNVTNKAKIGNSGKDARGASWADIDNDGDLDLFIANFTGSPTLLRNDRGKFVDISDRLGASGEALGPSTAGGIWLDFNNDANVDLFVVRDGARNQLFKHIGFAEFSNIAGSANVDDRGPGRSAVTADFDNDGFVDIYVVNFDSPNKLFLNNQDETFRDITASAGVGFSGKSVQAIAADYDLDQDADIFVVNNEGLSVLYRNDGNLEFTDVASRSGLKRIKKGIAAAFADYDNDADEDLVIAQSEGGNFLLTNNGRGRFKKVKNIDLNNPDNPTGVAIGDFNNDGLPDIVIADGDESQDNGDSLYENTGGAGSNYLVLILEGTSSNRSAIGAKAVVQTGLLFQAKTVSSGNSQNQESLPLEFGLGAATFADTIQISWPSGRVQTLQNVQANQTLRVTEE